MKSNYILINQLTEGTQSTKNINPEANEELILNGICILPETIKPELANEPFKTSKYVDIEQSPSTRHPKETISATFFRQLSFAFLSSKSLKQTNKNQSPLL